MLPLFDSRGNVEMTDQRLTSDTPLTVIPQSDLSRLEPVAKVGHGWTCSFPANLWLIVGGTGRAIILIGFFVPQLGETSLFVPHRINLS
jgi:hypothetical protein